MLKKLSYTIGILFVLGSFCACNDPDAGLNWTTPEEVIPDGPDQDSTSQEPNVPGDSEIYGDPHIVETVEMPEGYWSIIREWPGIPGDTSMEKRWANVKIKIDAVYHKRHPDDRFGGIGNTPWFSTGLYAGPGEVITIRKPEALRGKRVVCRIGSSTCELKEKHRPWKRLPKTFETKVLKDDDTTRMYNYNGGNIYIIPDQPFSEPQVFEFTGVMKSPDFVLGVTDARKWKEEVSKTTIPMGEIAGKRVIWTMPTGVGYLRDVTDPVALMEFYDDVVLNDFYPFHGISESSFDPLHRAPTFASRHVTDIQLCAGAAHAGYPCMYGLNYGSRGVQLEMMRTTNNAWGFYHELGHNYQVYCWKWQDAGGSIGEVSNNFHIMYSRNRMLNKWHQGTESYQERINNFMAQPIAERDFETEDEEILDLTTRLIPFCQLAQQYGWKYFAYLSTKSRELPNNIAAILSGSAKEARKDFFCITVCEYAGVDLRKFFDAWGIKYTKRAGDQMAKLIPYTGEEFWKTWNDQIIPDRITERVPEKIDDFTYGIKAGEVLRNQWVVDEVESNHIFTDAPVANMLDGASGTYWASESVTRPVYNVKPVIVIDMVSSYQIDYLEWLHRQDMNYGQLQCKYFTLEVKDYYGEEWVKVKTQGGDDVFTLTTAMSTQKINFDKPYQAQFLRITLLEGQASSVNGSVCVAEFKVGKNTQ